MVSHTNSVRLCILFGPKIPPIHRRGIYLLLAIVALQRFTYFNGKSLLYHLLPYSMKFFHNDYVLPFLTQIPFMSSVFIGLFSDMLAVRRVRLVHFSLIVGLFSSLFLVGATLLIYLQLNNLGGYVRMDHIEEGYRIAVCVFLLMSYILFLIASSIFYPMSLVYGLDLLFETPQVSSLLIFPLFYFAINIGGIASYMSYVRFEFETYLFHSIAVLLISLLSCIVFWCGRYGQWLNDSILIPTEYSFRKSVGIICQSLRRMCQPRIDKDRSFLYLACNDNGGSYDKKMVSMVRSMIGLNVYLLLLLPVFGFFQVLNVLFPQQASILTYIGHHHNFSVNYCPVEHNEQTYINTLSFIDPLSIILFLPLFEFVFFDLTFGYERDVLPWYIKLISSKLKCLRVLRSSLIEFRTSLHNYFFHVDTTMKRSYWGLFVGLACVVAALIVEVLQMNQGTNIIQCPNRRAYRISPLTQSVQIPQYLLYGIFECITIVGLQQFVYFQCSNYFNSSMKGFFFGLYYAYQGLGQFLTSGLYLLLSETCKKNCSLCFIHHDHCKEDALPNTWIMWVITFFGLAAVIFLYPFIVHFRHYKYRKAAREFEREENERCRKAIANMTQPLLENVS